MSRSVLVNSSVLKDTLIFRKDRHVRDFFFISFFFVIKCICFSKVLLLCVCCALSFLDNIFKCTSILMKRSSRAGDVHDNIFIPSMFWYFHGSRSVFNAVDTPNKAKELAHVPSRR